MARIVILGAGMMGSAFSHLVADIGHEVCLVGTHLDEGIIAGIRRNRIHRKLKIRLPEKVTAFAYDQLDEVLVPHTDLLVIGVSSAGINWAAAQLSAHLKDSIPIILLTKGLAVTNHRLKILPDIVREYLVENGLDDVTVGAIAGPCIAGELAARRESSAVISFADKKLLNRFHHLLAAPYFHAQPESDIAGVEVCAALKNFYTIAVAYPGGQLEREAKAENRAAMNNPSAGLFTQALMEMRQITAYLGGDPTTVCGLAGVGDLYVTCQAGRNSRMGRLLGTGFCYSEAKQMHMAEETIEGTELALNIGPALKQLIAQGELDSSKLPLMLAIIDAICNDKSLEIPWKMFYGLAG